MLWIRELWMGKKWLGIWCCFLASCGSAPRQDPPGPASADHRNYASPPLDSLAPVLLTGDLIFRTGRDMTSYMLRQLNLRDKRFSHCGLVCWEDGYPYVYHSIGGEDNPDLALRRDSLNQWISPRNNAGASVFRLRMDSLGRIAVGDQARNYYEQRIPFDMAFDLSSDDRFYCAEFVYKTLRKAGQGEIPLSRFRGYTFVGIDDLYLHAQGDWIWELEYK